MTNLKKYISHKIWDKNMTTCKLVKKTLPLLIIRKIKQAAILSSYLTNKIQKMNCTAIKSPKVPAIKVEVSKFIQAAIHKPP